jgi:hypothetical protein
MIAAALALLTSPIAWFALLVLSLTSAGALLMVLIGGSRKPDYEVADPRDFDSPAARRYHGDDSIGRN